MRFLAKADAANALRNRGYDQALAGRPAAPPSDPQQASIYWQGYRRGVEAVGKRENESAAHAGVS